MYKIIASLLFLLLCENAWAHDYTFGEHLCDDNAQFHCYKTHHGDTWWKLFPNSKERDIVMRINRMNTALYPGIILAIPNSKEDTDMMDYTPLARQIDPPGEKVIYVSLNREAFGAYDADGNLVYWGPVSSARGYCPDVHRGCHTPTGHFEIESKEGSGCYSTKFPVGRGGAPMPYCMYFHRGFALHGSYEVPGYNDSHGCIRLFVNDARWLNENFTSDDYHAKVVVTQ